MKIFGCRFRYRERNQIGVFLRGVCFLDGGLVFQSAGRLKMDSHFGLVVIAIGVFHSFTSKLDRCWKTKHRAGHRPTRCPKYNKTYGLRLSEPGEPPCTLCEKRVYLSCGTDLVRGVGAVITCAGMLGLPPQHTAAVLFSIHSISYTVAHINWITLTNIRSHICAVLPYRRNRYMYSILIKGRDSDGTN